MAEKIQPFDAFSVVYKVLVLAGFYKYLGTPGNKFKRICHQIYRPIAFLVMVWYNISHIIYIVQRRHNMEAVFDCAFIEIPQMNCLVKVLSVSLQLSRFDKINNLLHDPILAAYSKKDEELLLENKRHMHGLCKFVNISLTVTLILWPLSHIARRYNDPDAVIPVYTPFQTETWIGFICALLLEVSPALWSAYGHLALDCLVATYYAQAEVQLKIIKYNLEHLFDAHSCDDRGYRQYRDITDSELRKRFVHYVQRYETVAWYTKEIGDIFNGFMSFQFFTSTATICMVIYKMSSTPVTSLPFLFLVLVFLIVLTQVFLYCHFGNLVQYESESVMTSVYLSEWLSASPQFRRLLLIAMLRWSRTITPRVAGAVPLSLNTFFVILKTAYSVNAVLMTKQ